MGKGLTLFGWCLPDMGRDQHEACRVSFTYYDTTPSCQCPCHSDTTWLDSKFNAPKPRKRKAKA